MPPEQGLGTSKVVGTKGSSVYTPPSVRQPCPAGGNPALRATPDPRTAFRFLAAMYGPEAPGFLVLFTLPDARTYPVPSSELEMAALTIARLARRHDVYAGIGLQGVVPEGKARGCASGVVALPGLWLDLDLRTPYRDRGDLPATVEEATDFLDALPLRPTGVVHSGGGLYPWWCFRELWIFESGGRRREAARVSRGWQRYVLDMARDRHGWKLDATPDLARILRVPGTLNRKGSRPALVRILRGGGPRYIPEDFAGYRVAPPRDERAPAPLPDTPRGGRYVAAAIKRECRKLVSAPEGSRNETLNRSAYSLARFVASGEADAYMVARELSDAAARAGLEEREIARTLESAFSARGAV